MVIWNARATEKTEKFGLEPKAKKRKVENHW